MSEARRGVRFYRHFLNFRDDEIGAPVSIVIVAVQSQCLRWIHTELVKSRKVFAFIHFVISWWRYVLWVIHMRRYGSEFAQIGRCYLFDIERRLSPVSELSLIHFVFFRMHSVLCEWRWMRVWMMLGVRFGSGESIIGLQLQNGWSVSAFLIDFSNPLFMGGHIRAQYDMMLVFAEMVDFRLWGFLVVSVTLCVNCGVRVGTVSLHNSIEAYLKKAAQKRNLFEFKVRQ